jgi:hypothetical protein
LNLGDFLSKNFKYFCNSLAIFLERKTWLRGVDSHWESDVALAIMESLASLAIMDSLAIMNALAILATMEALASLATMDALASLATMNALISLATMEALASLATNDASLATMNALASLATIEALASLAKLAVVALLRLKTERLKLQTLGHLAAEVERLGFCASHVGGFKGIFH